MLLRHTLSYSPSSTKQWAIARQAGKYTYLNCSFTGIDSEFIYFSVWHIRIYVQCASDVHALKSTWPNDWPRTIHEQWNSCLTEHIVVDVVCVLFIIRCLKFSFWRRHRQIRCVRQFASSFRVVHCCLCANFAGDNQLIYSHLSIDNNKKLPAPAMSTKQIQPTTKMNHLNK